MTQFKKTSVALAAAALASGAAFAQSSVTVNGVVDIGFSHRSDSFFDHQKSKNSVDSGQSTGSRISFSGAEDLGNGNKAIFMLEAGFSTDTGSHADPAGQLFNEQAYLGLTGNWGTAIAGRLVTPRHEFLRALDPFHAGTTGSYRNVYNDVPLTDVDRVNNTVAYVSPSFSGFNVTAAYATDAVGEENPGGTGDARVIALLPRYANGPLDIGVSYQHIKIKAPSGFSDTKQKQWTLGGSYDFGALKLSAAYDSAKLDDGSYSDKLKTWLLGVSVPFGQHAVQASWSQSKYRIADRSSGEKARQWAIGYTYDLSKRTTFYSAYSSIRNDDRRTSTVGDAHHPVLPEGEGYQKGFQLGLRHAF
ncbi:MAG: porin [Zoogloeaceae bacterium]|jgi:predicted porin|nr:porin [Zoogloeaceae bacterium]